jgi:predicted hotdog family 3-hydroxylacyl-ACP dehydratase
MMDASTCDIETLIPHRPPMRLVETVCTADDSSVETVSMLRETWPTVQDGRARSLVLIELVAQSAAALAGWVERNEAGPKGLGYLVGVPKADLCRSHVAVGTELHCHVRITEAIDTYRGFEGRVVDRNGEELAQVTIQAFRPEREP